MSSLYTVRRISATAQRYPYHSSLDSKIASPSSKAKPHSRTNQPRCRSIIAFTASTSPQHLSWAGLRWNGVFVIPRILRIMVNTGPLDALIRVP